MSELTVDEFAEILQEAAGESVLGSDIADTPFAELGFDSLALLETAALVKRRYGVAIPDNQLGDLVTPAAFLATVNARLAAA